ncbi:MAG: transposase [Dehalococcoidia bacterium]|nr:transposase [Dehalococcoidia bacterium]
MRYDQDKHHRRSIRLGGYDYAQPGAYFVTICTYQRECLLGEIVDGNVRLSASGQIVADAWVWLAVQYPYVELDVSVVMPNHLHGVVVIRDDVRRGGSRTAPTQGRKPLGRLIGAFKTVSTKRLNRSRLTPGAPLWQRDFYEHVIRTDAELMAIREYILANPAGWDEDENNPDFTKR